MGGKQSTYDELLDSFNGKKKSRTECIDFLISQGLTQSQANNAVHVYRKGGAKEASFMLSKKQRDELLDGIHASRRSPKECVNYLIEKGCTYRQATSAVYKYRQEKGLIGTHQTGLVEVKMFVLGKTYRRRDLHEFYGGQQRGGISTPADYSFIMLFTGESGNQYGYHDGWTKEGIFLYTGEGQRGDMTFVRGNLAIKEHVTNGKDIHLFEDVQRGHVRYVSQMICTGFQERRGLDVDGKERKVLVFELTPVDVFSGTPSADNETQVKEMWQQSLATLRKRAMASSTTARSPAERKAIVRYRSTAIRTYVLKRAGGVCEGCGESAPFKTSEGRPYLEPHHLRRLSDGGPDDPFYVAGLCPNCHRRAHYSVDRDEFNQRLTRIVNNIEAQ